MAVMGDPEDLRFAPSPGRAISGSSPTASIAVALLDQADASEKQAVTTLFSSLGIGRNVDASV